MIELWKPLIHDKINDGFELSSLGRIRSSIDKMIEPYEAEYHSTNGYDYSLFLMKFDPMHMTTKLEHRLFPIDELLAQTFIPIPDTLIGKMLTVHHIDGDTRNNRIDNLEWVEDVEEWREMTFPEVKPGMYRISNHGRIFNNFTNKEIFPFPNHGYLVFGMVKYDGSQRHVFTHRVVAYEFMTGYDKKLDVNHIDGVKTNNHVKNLELISRSKNIRHAIQTGLNPMLGEEHPGHKLLEEDVHKICELFVEYNGSIQQVLDDMHRYPKYQYITRYMLERIKHKKNWSWISDAYFMENQFDKCVYGEKNIGAKLTNNDARLICEKLVEYHGSVVKVLEYMKSTGNTTITRYDIEHIKYKKNWVWLSDEYFVKDAFKLK